MLQLLALRQDPHPALCHSVEVGSVGNHLQSTQVIQLQGRHGEQVADQCAVEGGSSPAAGEAGLAQGEVMCVCV